MSPLDHQGNYYAGDKVRPDAALASVARTTTGVGAAFNTDNADAFEGFLTVTAATAPTSLDVRLETSLDAGATWATVGAFAQVTTETATRNRVFGPLGDSCRWAWTIVGTSFTFAVAVEANE
jgi:hypothetical protein